MAVCLHGKTLGFRNQHYISFRVCILYRRSGHFCPTEVIIKNSTLLSKKGVFIAYRPVLHANLLIEVICTVNMVTFDPRSDK